MLVEPIVCLVLHCSRCNEPFKDDDTDLPAWWRSPGSVEETFSDPDGDLDVSGWRRFGVRYICPDGCLIVNEDGEWVENPEPLPPVEADKVVRAQAGYRSYEAAAAAVERAA